MIPRITALICLAVLCSLSGHSPAARTAPKGLPYNQPAKYGVYIADLQSKKIRYVGGVYDWSVSPDGKLIAGVYFARDFADLYLFPVTPGPKKFVTRFYPIGPAVHPALIWSEDSSNLFVACDWNSEDDREEEHIDVFLTDTAAADSLLTPEEARQLVDKAKEDVLHEVDGPKPVDFRLKGSLTGYDVIETAYSPDDKLVALTCKKGDYGKKEYSAGVFICRPDGTPVEQVTRFFFRPNLDPAKYDYRTDGEDREIEWLGDGKSLIFRRTSHEDEGI